MRRIAESDALGRIGAHRSATAERMMTAAYVAIGTAALIVAQLAWRRLLDEGLALLVTFAR